MLPASVSQLLHGFRGLPFSPRAALGVIGKRSCPHREDNSRTTLLAPPSQAAWTMQHGPRFEPLLFWYFFCRATDAEALCREQSRRMAWR